MARVKAPFRTRRPPETEPDVLRTARRGTAGGGRPLDPAIRARMEARFAAEFGHVRLHSDATAGASAAELGASAYTVGADVVLGAGVTGSEQLLAHELTHVVQQRHGVTPGLSRAGDASERQAGAVAERVAAGREAGPLPGAGPVAAVQRQPGPGHPGIPTPEAFIEKYLTRHPFDPAAGVAELSERLFWVMWSGPDHYPFVREVLAKLGDLDDDVASAMVLGGKAKDLDDLAGSPAGRELLDDMFDRMISGRLADTDEQAALAILRAQARRIPIDQFVEQAETAPIFPVRQMGITRASDAPLDAHLLPNGKIWVKLPARVPGTRMFRQEAQTVPPGTFSSGAEVEPDALVGVRDFDTGGQVEFLPAKALLMLGSKTTTSTWGTIATVASAGVGVGVTGGAAATTWIGRALLWADRAALVVGAIGTVVNEHRDWAVATFGKDFVRLVDVANNVVAVYGVTRLAHAAGSVGVKLTGDLKGRWDAFRKHRNYARLKADPAAGPRIAALEKAIGDLPAPPPTVRQRMAKAMDEWATEPAGGLSMAGAKEADELLKAGWRKIRKITPKAKAPAKAGAPKKAAPPKKSPGKPKPAAKPVRFEDRVHTGYLDEYGRGTSVYGELHPADLRTGTPTGHYHPPGLGPGELNRFKARRGHMVANLFGGKGTDPGNLVYIHERINNSTFKLKFEHPVWDALERGEKVRFGVQAFYRGAEAAPFQLEVWATTASGKTIVAPHKIRTPGLSDIDAPVVQLPLKGDVPVPPPTITRPAPKKRR